MSMVTVLIRTAEVGDLDGLYEVCLLTGDAGRDGSNLYDDPRLLGEIYVGPYVTLPSGIGFTAVENGRPAGYALGTLDTRQFETECETTWWPELRERYPDPGPHPSTPDDELTAEIYRPHLASDRVVSDFPAQLPLDLLPNMQGRGVGRLMMDRLLSPIIAGGAPGVHMNVATQNHRAIGFYTHLGFSIIETGDDAVVMGIRLSDELPSRT